MLLGLFQVYAVLVRLCEWECVCVHLCVIVCVNKYDCLNSFGTASRYHPAQV